MTETFSVTSLESLDPVVNRVLEIILKSSPKSSATVLALSGDLGAGKTTFTQQLAAKLGVDETVTSPTFVVMKKYPLEHSHFDTVVHVDAYRLESVAELAPLHFAAELSEPRSLIVIEWAERINAALPPDHLTLSFTLAGETRELTLTYES